MWGLVFLSWLICERNSVCVIYLLTVGGQAFALGCSGGLYFPSPSGYCSSQRQVKVGGILDGWFQTISTQAAARERSWCSRFALATAAVTHRCTFRPENIGNTRNLTSSIAIPISCLFFFLSLLSSNEDGTNLGLSVYEAHMVPPRHTQPTFPSIFNMSGIANFLKSGDTKKNVKAECF